MRRRFLTDVLRTRAGSALLPHRVRPFILRMSGVLVGPSCLIMPGLRLPRHGLLSIGRNVFINYDCYFDLNADVVIEDKVRIADHVRILTGTHEIGGDDLRAGPLVARAVKVERGCWIGASVTILPGVTIGRGCIVAAGSVVVEDCDPDGLYAGVPAKRRRELQVGGAHEVAPPC